MRLNSLTRPATSAFTQVLFGGPSLVCSQDATGFSTIDYDGLLLLQGDVIFSAWVRWAALILNLELQHTIFGGRPLQAGRQIIASAVIFGQYIFIFVME